MIVGEDIMFISISSIIAQECDTTLAVLTFVVQGVFFDQSAEKGRPLGCTSEVCGKQK